jgi:hypothetical protein
MGDYPSLLWGWVDAVPARRRSGRGGGQPSRPAAAAPAWQVRSAGCRGGRPGGPGAPGQHPKAGDGQVELIRSLRVARASASKARSQAINALKGAAGHRARRAARAAAGLSTVRLVQTTAGLEPGAVTSPLAAARPGLQTLARRSQARSAELSALDAELDRLTAAAAPQAGGALWGRGGLGRGAAGRRRRQPRAAALGRGVCDAVRGLADPGLLGQDPPASAQPGWRSPGQRGAVADRGGAAAPPAQDPGTTWRAGSAGASPRRTPSAV